MVSMETLQFARTFMDIGRSEFFVVSMETLPFARQNTLPGWTGIRTLVVDRFIQRFRYFRKNSVVYCEKANSVASNFLDH